MNTASKSTRSFIEGLDIDIMPKKVATHAAIDSLRPDPSQPRKNFDEEELNGLAISITAHGVVSAIKVLAAENGIYTIVFGERRWRAAKIAGLTEVPITIVDPSQINIRAVQLVENIQRARLSPEEIAVAMDELAQTGMKAAEIASQLGMSKAQVSKFRSVVEMPPMIRERLNKIGMETAYQLFGLWKKDMPAVEHFLRAAAPEEINRQAVARFAETLNRKDALAPQAPAGVESTGSGSMASGSSPSSDEGAVERLGAGGQGRVRRQDEADRLGTLAGAASSSGATPHAPMGVYTRSGSGSPVFIVQVGDEHGRLLIDRPGPDSKTALVSFNQGEEIRPVPLSDLTIFEIV